MPRPSPRLGIVFWLGFMGALLGFFLAVTSPAGWTVDIGAVLFPIIGLAGASRLRENDTINAGLMLLAGVGMFFFENFYVIAIISALLFFLGGALILLKKG